MRYTMWGDLRAPSITFPTTAAAPIVLERDWRDVVSLRMGAECVAVPGLALRLGWGYDQSPAPSSTVDPLMPASERWLVGAGAAYAVQRGALRGFGLAAGYLAAISPRRASTSSDLPGATWSQTSHTLNAALSYAWDMPPIGRR